MGDVKSVKRSLKEKYFSGGLSDFENDISACYFEPVRPVELHENDIAPRYLELVRPVELHEELDAPEVVALVVQLTALTIQRVLTNLYRANVNGKSSPVHLE